MKQIKDIQPGMICKINGYTAQVQKKYDKTPTALVLRASKTRYLCFNINWLDRVKKKKLIEVLKKWLKDENDLKSNNKRMKFFNRLRQKNFPRSCYRVYLKAGLPEEIYQLNLDEFISAIKGDELTLVDNSKPKKSKQSKEPK